MTLARPNYMCYHSNNEVKEIFCKLCGAQIAGERRVLLNTRKDKNTGKIIEEYSVKFQRLPTYAELKMQFEDGSYHVTNGCSSCMQMHLHPEVLQELYDADAEEMKPELNMPPRKAVKAVAIATDQKGIV
jgi:hypothetical protein